MRGAEATEARRALGALWGKRRALSAAALGRALGYAGRDPGRAVRAAEMGEAALSPQAARLIALYLRGVLPPDGIP